MKHFPYIAIHHERLTLRMLEVCHAKLLFDLVEKEKKYLSEYMSWVHEERGVSTEIDRIARAGADYFSGKECPWGIWLEPEAKLIGTIGLRTPSVRDNPLMKEIGYWISEGYRGRGFATLATQMAIVTAFSKLGSDRVAIRHNRQNIPSRRVVEKCGFILEGTLRNAMAAPTAEMIARGHTRERTYLTYSLIPEDLPALPWYEEMCAAIHYEPLRQITE
jgi:ribosomal-protein-serine acetyltransferase